MPFKRVCLLVALIFICRTLSTATGQAASSETQETPPLRFRLVDGYRIIVACPIGTNGKMYNFLVDTGANPSVIDNKLAADLTLSGTPQRLALPSGTVEARIVELPMLAIGPIRRRNLPVLVRDLGYLQHGIRVDGIAGMDVLAAMSFTIDYQNQQLLFGSGIVKDTDAADFASGPPLVTVRMELDGDPIKMLVDTGTPGTLFFNKRMRGRLKGTRFRGGATAVNMAGRFSVDQLLLNELRFGQISLRHYPATLLQDNTEWGEAFDGLVGPAALNLKRITFDFENGKLRWKP